METAEAIQIEMRTPISISNEIKRLYNLKPEAALTLLYNVTETMTAMSPGRYLIRHTVSNGAFASIYKEADGPGFKIILNYSLSPSFCRVSSSLKCLEFHTKFEVRKVIPMTVLLNSLSHKRSFVSIFVLIELSSLNALHKSYTLSQRLSLILLKFH